VAILEINTKRWQEWWQKENKFELIVGLIGFFAILFFGDHPILALSLAWGAALWSLIRMILDRSGRKKSYLLFFLFFAFLGFEHLFAVM